VVIGADADLAGVLSRLLRADRLDIEVAYVPRRRTAATGCTGFRPGVEPRGAPGVALPGGNPDSRRDGSVIVGRLAGCHG